MVCCAGMRQIEIFFLQVMLGIFYTNFFCFGFVVCQKYSIDQKPKSPVDQKRAKEFTYLHYSLSISMSLEKYSQE